MRLVNLFMSTLVTLASLSVASPGRGAPPVEVLAPSANASLPADITATAPYTELTITATAEAEGAQTNATAATGATEVAGGSENNVTATAVLESVETNATATAITGEATYGTTETAVGGVNNATSIAPPACIVTPPPVAAENQTGAIVTATEVQGGTQTGNLTAADNATSGVEDVTDDEQGGVTRTSANTAEETAAAKPASSGSKAHQVDNIAGDGTNGNKGTLDDILALLNGVGNRKIVAIRGKRDIVRRLQ